MKDVAPYAGTISVEIQDRTVTLGLAAANKIWVYDPEDARVAAGPARKRAGRRVAAAR